VNKHFLSLDQLTKSDCLRIFDKSDRIRQDPRSFGPVLKGCTIGLLFEKPSLRTRVSFEVGINNLSGRPLYMSASEVQLGKREAVSDVARIVAGYLDGIIIRTFAHGTLEEFSRYSSVPVINGLTDRYHPAQVLSDCYTILKHKTTFDGRKIVYIGDGNNVCNSLIHGVSILGGSLTVASPDGYAPTVEGAVEIVHDPVIAVRDADVLYTDVWTSMGAEAEADERRRKFAQFQLNGALLKHARPDAIVMHCLPAHRGEEITDEVVDSRQSIVFEQAQNRLYVQQALMTEIFGNVK
jgi:ornithine carbamoyltransferase